MKEVTVIPCMDCDDLLTWTAWGRCTDQGETMSGMKCRQRGNDMLGFEVEKKQNPCAGNQFHCVIGGTCIPSWLECDGVKDCHDGEDEAEC